MNRESLFRKEFIRQDGNGLDGDVWLGAPRSWKIAVAIAMPIIFSIFAFVSTLSYAKKEEVVGRLVPPGGIIRVIARSGGIITDLNIKEGENVNKEQIMATLSLSTNILGGNFGTSMEAATNTEINSIEHSGLASRELLEGEKISLETQRNFLLRERKTNTEIQENLKNKENLLRSELERLTELHLQGFFTRTNVDIKKADLLAAEQASIQNSASLYTIDRQIAETESKLKAIPNRLKEQYSQRIAQQAALKQKLMQVEAQSSENIIAPISGVVAAIQSKVGQTLLPGGVIAVLTSEAGDLEAELYVPSRAIGFVRKEQDVALHFQAFSYQRYGSGRGTIVSVSKTVIGPSDAPDLGLEIKEPVFMVKVKISSQDIKAYGEKIKLQPGMLLNAQIILERRNLLQFLFDPILAVGDRN